MRELLHPARILLIIIFVFIAFVGYASFYGGIAAPDKSVTPIPGPFQQKLYTIRDAFIARLNYAIPEPHAAFVAGALIGTRSDLPYSIKQDFARTSTSHIIAVSGYNITIIATAIAWIFTSVMRRSRAFWCIVVVLGLFMILTGGSASVVRATIMGVLALCARQVGRLNNAGYALMIAAGIMIALDPTILRYDIGFQLSFMATVGILLVSPLAEKALPMLTRWGIFGETLIMTCSAQICVIPLLAYYFKTVSLISLPVNLLVLPTIPFFMMMGFVTGTVGFLIPALSRLFGYFVWMASVAILGTIHWFASVSWAVAPVNLSMGTTMTIYGLMAFLYWYIRGLNFFKE